MKSLNSFIMLPGWRIVLKDIGLDPEQVLARAGLPSEMLARRKPVLSTEDYFKFWRSIDQSANSSLLPLRMGETPFAETFDPGVFATTCSPNLQIGMHRLAEFKSLVSPLSLLVTENGATLQISLDTSGIDEPIPPPLAKLEMLCLVRMARIATRERVVPLSFMSPDPMEPHDAYQEFLGVAPQEGREYRVTFSAEDAVLPFLTANERMWKTFSPALRARPSEIFSTAPASVQVRNALLKLMPAGKTGIEDVCERLQVSKRTLQRKLMRDGTSYSRVLGSTRMDLAKHYLETTTMRGAEISLLLGFADANSFVRSFRDLTGETPESYRGSIVENG